MLKVTQLVRTRTGIHTRLSDVTAQVLNNYSYCLRWWKGHEGGVARHDIPVMR